MGLKPKVGFIVQRYGAAITGGSEYHCRMVAERMSRHWQVEVLTTCARDYVTWANHYPATKDHSQPSELGELGGVAIRRFPVAMRRRKWLFDRLYDILAPLATADKPRRGGKLINPLLKVIRKVLKVTGILSLLERTWMILQGPYSPALTRYVKEHSKDYDALIGFSYVYATTYFGLRSASCPTLLVPTAHDDPPIRFEIYKPLFAHIGGILANTHEERDLLQSHFPAMPEASIVGCGIDVASLGSIPTADDVAAFKTRHGIEGPYVVYVGRIEPFKGCQDLFERFLSQDNQTNLKLVLVGKAEMPIPTTAESGGRIIPLGFVSEQDKSLAIAGSEFLVMPSPYESLSLVLLEAWQLGKPVLVNGACAVLKGQCQRSGGGMWFDTWSEFGTVLATLHQRVANDPHDQATLRGFVEANYSWDAIANLYLQGLHSANASRGGSLPAIEGKSP